MYNLHLSQFDREPIPIQSRKLKKLPRVAYRFLRSHKSKKCIITGNLFNQNGATVYDNNAGTSVASAFIRG
ncbi:MAG: hypothetical protein KZQ66_04285 [Candidatus Thiodiazotropha sp. (ex Lucinoma aequizonata)]|nr:hypothetical protein [Candidatus Thiodiazotropha sp. (ex Lucinoma aequizonata)]MCU7901310.1 hypothetical protein [Candidatus Thiodiazotropha sp. (ex Lucinoma aequizonata)]MCU7910462.1 hypothetical protein [Candidatus Thiodiazotropha sp. (ex Lucinoma aequizonata)]MCU7910996.1 hypothetical protein [Candidatus Thiodiazotropha sp. (ex Lucinoma aequizonata)]